MAKTAATTKTAAKAAAPAKPDTCRCTCGEAVNAGRMFRQGHDQRLVSEIAYDLVSGTGRGKRILSADDANEDIQWRIDAVRDYVAEKISPALAAKVHAASMRRWQVTDLKEQRAAERAERKAKAGPEWKTETARIRKAKADKKAAAAAAAAEVTPVAVGEVPADAFQGLPEAGSDHPRGGDIPEPTKPVRRRRTTKAATPKAVDNVPETDDELAPPAKRTRRVGPAKTAAVGLGAPIKIKVRSRTVEATVAAMNQAGKVTVATYVDGRGSERRVENPRMVSNPDAQVGTS